MRNPRLAGRYAKSLIDLAIEQNQLEAVYQDMEFLQKVCKSSRDFVIMLKSPVINSDKKISILEAVTAKRITIVTGFFIKLLIKKNREAYLPEIAAAFISQYKDHEKIYIVNLTTATAVSEDLKNAIIQKIQAETQMKQIELHAEVNENLIGGFVLEIGDQLVDASIAFDLNNVKKQFQNNEFIYRLR